jgi:branched-chain amino acid transport system substrate-binding protein
VLAGDGFRVVARAIEATKSTKAADISKYLKTQLKEFPGFTGKIAFNEKGDRVGELYRVYKVDAGGNFVLQQ